MPPHTLQDPQRPSVRDVPARNRTKGSGAAGDTPACSFRLATRDDAAAIARIYNDSVPHAPAAITPLHAAGRRIHADTVEPPPEGRPLARSRMHALTEAQIQPWIALHEIGRRPLWLAQVRGDTIGWISLLGFSDRPGCSCAAEVSVYVARSWQGQGIGSGLLHKAWRDAPTLGIDRLMAFVWRSNAVSLKLFHRRGYSIWGALPDVLWVEGRSDDMVILGRKLDRPVHELPQLS